MIDADVIVVGAGPAGSTAAALLAAQGYRVTLVDRARFPREKPCGDYCNPGAAELLESWGLGRQLTAAGAGRIAGMTVVAQDGSGFTAPFPSGGGVLIPRRRLDTLLLARALAAGAQMVDGYPADEVSVGDSVTVRSSHRRGRPIRGRMLIAADGMRSVIAGRMGLRTPPLRGRFTVGAYFSGVGGPPAGALHLGGTRYGGVARFGDGTANVCLALPPAMFKGRTAERAFAAGVRALPVLADTVAGWARESLFRVTGPVGFAAHPVATDRILLAGDAAGQVEPLTGQGIYLALRSGQLAAEEASAALRRGDCSARALQTYTSRRVQLFGRKLRVMKTVTSLALRPSLTPWLVRRLGQLPARAQLLLGASGDLLDPGTVLSPRYLFGLLLGHDAHLS